MVEIQIEEKAVGGDQQVEVKQKVDIDATDWDMGRYADYLELVQSGQLRPVWKLLAEIIKAWPYPGSPSDPAAYAKLAPKQWVAVRDAVAEYLGAIFR